MTSIYVNMTYIPLFRSRQAVSPSPALRYDAPMANDEPYARIGRVRIGGSPGRKHRGSPRGGEVRWVLWTTVAAASVLPSDLLIFPWVMRLDSPLGIPPETEPPDDLGRPVCPGGPGPCSGDHGVGRGCCL